MSNTAGRGERTRSGIVASAKQLFYQHGYDGTSFADIVSAAGLSRGNIYHYFKTKDEILQAVIEQRLEEYRALLAQWERESDDPKQRLRAFAGMIAGQRLELAEFGCPIGSLNTELGKGRRELQRAARALFDLFRDWLRARFTELGWGEEAEAQALHLLGRAQGIAVIAHVYHDPQLLQQEGERLLSWLEQLPIKRTRAAPPPPAAGGRRSR